MFISLFDLVIEISSATLNQVAQWLKRWLEHEVSREDHVASIVELIRFEHLSISTLMDMENWDCINSNLIATRAVSKAKDMHLSKLTKTPSPKNRKPRDSYAGLIVCVGGRSNMGPDGPQPLDLVEYITAGSSGKFGRL